MRHAELALTAAIGSECPGSPLNLLFVFVKEINREEFADFPLEFEWKVFDCLS